MGWLTSPYFGSGGDNGSICGIVGANVGIVVGGAQSMAITDIFASYFRLDVTSPPAVGDQGFGRLVILDGEVIDATRLYTVGAARFTNRILFDLGMSDLRYPLKLHFGSQGQFGRLVSPDGRKITVMLCGGAMWNGTSFVYNQFGFLNVRTVPYGS